MNISKKKGFLLYVYLCFFQEIFSPSDNILSSINVTLQKYCWFILIAKIFLFWRENILIFLKYDQSSLAPSMEIVLAAPSQTKFQTCWQKPLCFQPLYNLPIYIQSQIKIYENDKNQLKKLFKKKELFPIKS